MTPLTDEEVAVLRDILSRVVVRQCTGQVGVIHGMERFVPINLPLKKPQRLVLESAARKLRMAALAVDKG